jgi:hypothetical protein
MAMVKQLQDQQLIQLVQDRTNPSLQMAAMGELQSRHQMRSASQAQGAQQQQQQQAAQTAQQAQQGTQRVLAQQQADKLGGGIGQLPAPNMAQMAGGGIVAFDDGGSTATPQGAWSQADYSTYMPTTPDTVQSPWAVLKDWFSSAGQTPLTVHPGMSKAGPIRPGQASGPPPNPPGWDNPANWTGGGTRFNPQAAQTAPGEVLDAAGNRLSDRPAAFRAAMAAQHTAPASSPTPAASPDQGPQQPDDMAGFAAWMRPLSDHFGTPDPATDTLAKKMAALEANKRANQGLSLLHAGAAMLQNTSPFAAVALGKGVDAYATSKEAGQAAEQAGLAQIAGQQGEQYKTQMAYAGTTDAAKAHIYGLNYMQYMTKGLQFDQNAQQARANVFTKAFEEITSKDMTLQTPATTPELVMQRNLAWKNAAEQAAGIANRWLEQAGYAHRGSLGGAGGPTSQGSFQHGTGAPPQAPINPGAGPPQMGQ